MQAIAVGMPLARSDVGFQDGMQYNYTAGGHTLTMVIKDPNRAEVHAVQRGQAWFALALKENAIFILSKFGNLSWKAAHYNWWINAPVLRPDPWGDMERLNGGVAAAVCLVNARTGLVAALRTVRLSRELSQVFIEMVQAQMRPPFDPWSYQELVERTFLGHPDPGTLLKDALCMCAANLPSWEPLGAWPRGTVH